MLIPNPPQKDPAGAQKEGWKQREHLYPKSQLRLPRLVAVVARLELAYSLRYSAIDSFSSTSRWDANRAGSPLGTFAAHPQRSSPAGLKVGCRLYRVVSFPQVQIPAQMDWVECFLVINLACSSFQESLLPKFHL